jgi:hypothetical protein
MHSVNLDLIHAISSHHPDGRAKDPHASHRAEHLANLRAARRARWQAIATSVQARTRTLAANLRSGSFGQMRLP